MSTLETLMIVFIAVTALAVVIQMALLAALYIGVRKSSLHLETLVEQLAGRILPLLETAQTMLEEYRPKLYTVLDNVAKTTTTVEQQVKRLDAGIIAVSDHVRLQATRLDELVSHTFDRVEKATELVHQSVVSPVRQASGIFQGITAGLATLLNKGCYARAKRGAGIP